MRVTSADPVRISNGPRQSYGILKVAPGEVFEVIYNGKLSDGAYTYSVHDKVSAPEFYITSDKAGSPFLPLTPVSETANAKGVERIDQHGKIFEPFSWRQEVVVSPDAKPGDYELIASIKLQICDRNCWVGFAPDLKSAIRVQGVATPLNAGVKARIHTGGVLPPRSPAPKRSDPVPSDDVESIDTPSPVAQGGLGSFLVKAFLGAFFMLLTPCVFPMIPITVNFFLKQAEREHHRPLPTALIYSLTIIVVLSLSVFFLGDGIIRLANNAWFNLALGLAMVYFALSLFGMYEVELPSFLARLTSSREGKGGVEGTIFMALTFTITSFTCTGPFLGMMLGLIAASEVSRVQLALGALVYSATFAAPFFLLALFPSYLRKLPKAGDWLTTVKVSMGFLELAFALKFLANADISWFPSDPVLFNYDTVLVAWIVLSLMCGLYLLGLFRLAHDEPSERTGVVRMLCSALMFGLALYMVPFLFGSKPRGAIANSIVAFLPPDLKHRHHLDYDEAYKDAIATNKPIFIDFTGVKCPNCRYNEENVFPRPDIASLLSKYVVVQLYTDTVPKHGLSLNDANALAEKHTAWRKKLVNDDTLPYYVVFQPDPNVAFVNGVPKGKRVGIFGGQVQDHNVNQFMSMLKRPFSQ